MDNFRDNERVNISLLLPFWELVIRKPGYEYSLCRPEIKHGGTIRPKYDQDFIMYYWSVPDFIVYLWMVQDFKVYLWSVPDFIMYL